MDFNKGTTHGVWNRMMRTFHYFGTARHKRGRLYREVYMTDIAPTLAAVLGIQMPNAAMEK
jgi:hypothetical protein